MISKNYKVCQIGWKDENTVASVVLLDGNERALLDIHARAVIKVKKKLESEIYVEALAFVHVQFREYIGKEMVTLSSKLAELLQCKLNEELTITKEVTESESERFMNSISRT